MTPTEFLLWLNAAVDLVDGGQPTAAQWAKIQEKAGEAMGALGAKRIFEQIEQARRGGEQAETKAKMQVVHDAQIGPRNFGVIPPGLLQEWSRGLLGAANSSEFLMNQHLGVDS